MANDDFLNPLDALIPKIPFSVFADFWVRVTSGAWGSVSVGFSGGHQWSLLGVQLWRAVSTPPPLKFKAQLPLYGVSWGTQAKDWGCTFGAAMMS